ncbi:hypothetical protein EGW08_018005, partial [Elysia chlorotica]
TDTERRQPPVSFTLPISCQVCLGKVKQPVVCPNLHVFCERCLEVWLKRNNQCPSCRAVISPDNPAKHIIGGQAEEEHPTRQSCPELRRARFDLLYLEYEDQIEQLKKENLILRTENNILVSQVKETDKAKENGKTDAGPGSSGTKAPDGPSLLMLTRNLQEAQKLYSNIKDDMAHMKQENVKMKDENMALTRENENLRLELAQRSPKKFGRYTVATLETKVSEQEKQIRQLTKALERSDTFIEELQKKLEESNAASADRGRDSRATSTSSSQGMSQHANSQASSSRETFNINMVASDKQSQRRAVESFSFRVQEPLPSDKARRLLFGKVFVDEPPSTKTAKQKEMEKDAGSSAYSSKQDQDFAVSSTNQERSGGTSERNRPMPESILKTQASSSRREASQRVESMDMNEEEETPRRVHFDVSPPRHKIPEESASFDLELPSPMDRSTSTPREAVTSGSKGAGPAPTSVKEEIQWEDSEFDIKVKDLLRKNAQTLKRSGSLETVSSQGAHSAKKSNKGQKGKAKQIGSPAVKSSKMPDHDANDSSRLSVPDMNSSNVISDLSGMEDDDDRNTNHSEDLNISMTPELSDCLKLMDRAEKNMVSVPPSSRAFPLPGSSVVLPPRPSSVPPHLGKPLVPSSVMSGSNHHSAGFSASTTATSASTGWEQQFYSSLRTNPYKQPSSGGPHLSHPQQETFPPFSSIGKLESLSDEYGGISSAASQFSSQHNSANQDRSKSLHSYLARPPSPSYSFSNSQKQAFQAPDHTSHFNSRPPFTASSFLHSAGSSKTSSSTLPNKFNLPGGSSTLSSNASTASSLSSLAPSVPSYTPMMPHSSSSSSATTDAFKFSSSSNSHFSSSFGRIGKPSALSTHSPAGLHHTNPLPPSLNNSTLHWPESASPDRFSRRNFLPDDLDTTNSDDRPQSRDFGASHGPTNDFNFQTREEKHYQHSRWRQTKAATDDSFCTAMEPPTSGYPADLSHEMSSNSDMDFFSSPRLRRFSYPHVSGTGSVRSDDGCNTSGIDDMNILDQP